jgi:hypothetical protein
MKKNEIIETVSPENWLMLAINDYRILSMIGWLPSGSGRQLNRQLTRLLLLAGCLSVSSGCVTQPTNGPLAEAQSNLKEARRARSDSRIAAADYLEAADIALRSMNKTTGEEATEVRLTYNSACQELALLLRNHNEPWHRATELKRILYLDLATTSQSRRSQ